MLIDTFLYTCCNPGVGNTRLFHPFSDAWCGLGKYNESIQLKCILFVIIVFYCNCKWEDCDLEILK